MSHCFVMFPVVPLAAVEVAHAGAGIGFADGRAETPGHAATSWFRCHRRTNEGIAGVDLSHTDLDGEPASVQLWRSVQGGNTTNRNLLPRQVG